jgi:uncharacterized YigZ family protein
MDDFFLTIEKNGRSVFKDRGSRFLGFAWAISSEEEVKEILETIKNNYHDARHHCYAYRLGEKGESFRANDDGEPSGSAGKPILNQIIGRGLTNVLVVVIRYFGGTLLGVGGLINAYRSAASDALDNSHIKKKYMEDIFLIEFDYSQTNEVSRLLNDLRVRILNQTFTEKCFFKISVLRSQSVQLTKSLSLLNNLLISPADDSTGL